jgi:hypothetical protein
MALIRRLLWTVGTLSLLPLAIATQIDTGTPGSKPYIQRAPISPAPPKEPSKRYTVCGIAGAENCWELVGTPR